MDYLTVKEVAARMGVTEKSVRNWINDGDLTAFKLGTGWKITEEDLQQFIKSKSNVKKETN